MTGTVFGRTALLAALLPLAAYAQSESDTRREALRRCAELESLDERVACIDAVLGNGSGRAAETGGGERPRSADGSGASEDVRADDTAPTQTRDVEARASSADSGDENGERTVLIVDVSTRVPGRAIFTAENGERFEQTTGRSDLYLPPTPFQAVIRPGAIGSRFLVPEGQRRAIRIASEN